MNDDNNALIDRSRIDSDRYTKEMADTVSEATDLLKAYDGPGDYDPDLVGPRETVSREDCYFDGDEEDVLFDAWQMLRFCGVPEDNLEPLTIAIEADTIYDRESLRHYFENVVLDEME